MKNKIEGIDLYIVCGGDKDRGSEFAKIYSGKDSISIFSGFHGECDELKEEAKEVLLRKVEGKDYFLDPHAESTLGNIYYASEIIKEYHLNSPRKICIVCGTVQERSIKHLMGYYFGETDYSFVFFDKKKQCFKCLKNRFHSWFTYLYLQRIKRKLITDKNADWGLCKVRSNLLCCQGLIFLRMLFFWNWFFD